MPRSFLGLPFEIRHLIYQELLANTEMVLVRPQGFLDPHTPKNMGIIRERFWGCMGLLRTCRVIHDEARRVFYGKISFVILALVGSEYDNPHLGGFDEYNRRLEVWRENICERNFALIKRVKLWRHTYQENWVLSEVRAPFSPRPGRMMWKFKDERGTVPLGVYLH